MFFREGMRITQLFGGNFKIKGKWVYGSLGHPGLDFSIKRPMKDWSIICPSGRWEVLKVDEDKIYGNNITIWNRAFRLAFRLCHCDEIFVDKGVILTKGLPFARMGNTGKSTAAHVHLDAITTDEKGFRNQKYNKINGRVDPLPFILMLAELEGEDVEFDVL